MSFQLRRDTAANFTSGDPTLASGEVGFETDTFKFKIGDGSTAWTSLAYLGGPHQPGVATTVSGVDTVTASLSPVPVAYAELKTVLISWAGANTGAVTLNLNSLGAKSVVKANGTALAASDTATGRFDLLYWDNPNDRFQIVGL